MSSKRVENYRRTTKRLLVQQRGIDAAKALLADCSPVQRAEFAAWLLAHTAVKLDETPEAAQATLLAVSAEALKETLLHRAVAGAATGTTSPRVTEPPAAAPAPSAVPSAAISVGQSCRSAAEALRQQRPTN